MRARPLDSSSTSGETTFTPQDKFRWMKWRLVGSIVLGFVDPDYGGRVRTGIFGAYYKKEWKEGDILKVDGFLGRSLFDLYSNFTFFLNDQTHGDGIQQHDSRLQEGANAQFLHPFNLLGQRALFIAGSNFHDNQINVGLYPRIQRDPTGVTTRAKAHVTNTAGYLQQ